jgi:hypothetical protein
MRWDVNDVVSGHFIPAPLAMISSCSEDATQGHVMVGGFSIPTTNHADCSRNTRTTLERPNILREITSAVVLPV